MKILTYNIIKVYNKLEENNIVYSNINPSNILVKSPKEVMLCDFTESYYLNVDLKIDRFQFLFPKKHFTLVFLFPELNT